MGLQGLSNVNEGGYGDISYTRNMTGDPRGGLTVPLGAVRAKSKAPRPFGGSGRLRKNGDKPRSISGGGPNSNGGSWPRRKKIDKKTG